ncbi:MAG: 50S ribosomal protein L4 [bacterium]|nr:50S ribosomal protein L4 [bacterium]
MEFKIVDIKGKELGKDTLPDVSFDEKKANVDHWLWTVANYQRSTRQQGTHSCKNRAAVRGGGAKPYKQKGTGRARRGTNRTPLRVGGGVIFGPSPRSHSKDINKRFARRTINYVFNSRNDAVIVVDAPKDACKTKEVQALIMKTAVADAKRALFVIGDFDSPLYWACRNIKNSLIATPISLDVNELLDADVVYVEKEAFEVIKETFKS